MSLRCPGIFIICCATCKTQLLDFVTQQLAAGKVLLLLLSVVQPPNAACLCFLSYIVADSFLFSCCWCRLPGGCTAIGQNPRALPIH